MPHYMLVATTMSCWPNTNTRLFRPKRPSKSIGEIGGPLKMYKVYKRVEDAISEYDLNGWQIVGPEYVTAGEIVATEIARKRMK